MSKQLYAVEVTFASGTSWYHSGGSKTGAGVALYTDKGANRIAGRYKPNDQNTIVSVRKVPVAFGFAQEKADDNADDALFLRCLYSQGVDNWSGYEYAQDDYRELQGEPDE